MGKIVSRPPDYIIESVRSNAHSEEEKIKMYKENNFDSRAHFDSCEECQRVAKERADRDAWEKWFCERFEGP